MTADETASALPSCGVLSVSVKGKVCTRPRDIGDRSPIPERHNGDLFIGVQSEAFRRASQRWVFRRVVGGRLGVMTVGPGDDFELTMDELRVVARYVAESAQEVLPVFEDANPSDPRPRAAVDAAWEFVNGARRTKLQRVTSLDAHRAAKEATTETASLAARAAGDAASAAYLHPIAKATQVGHILRAVAGAARVAELNAGDDPDVGIKLIEQARQRATPVLIDVLDRYPLAPAGKSRVAQLMTILDASLRASR